MADVKWIKITTDIFSDEKILLIEQMPDADSLLVIWFKLLCMAGKENNYGVFLMRNRMPYTEEMLATIFRRPLNTVRLALSTFEAFGMIDIEDDVVIIPNWEKHQNIEGMEKIREQTRKRVAKHREKQKQALLTGGNGTNENSASVTVTLRNATDKIRIEEDIDNNISCAIPEESHDSFFERIWKLYPIKKGKGQVSKTKKQVLQRIGYEELERCVNRFVKTMESEHRDKQYWMHGSTFFNSGYVDYLDKNWTDTEHSIKANKPVPKNKFTGFEQREYDFDDIEEGLLAKK